MKVKKVKKPGGLHSILLRDVRRLQVDYHYSKLTNKLQTDLAEAGDGTLRQLISEASEDRRVSALIHVQGKRLRGDVTTEWDVAMGRWMMEARETIAGLKKDKKWDGQVTATDVERWILANKPEALALKKKLMEAEEICRTARGLHESYESRLFALQTYARLREAKIKLELDDFAEYRKQQNREKSEKAIEEA